MTEEVQATLEFMVTLSRGASETVTVDFATADGRHRRAGTYTAAEGTLTLSNVSGAHIADDVATGTIENDDPLQRAWLRPAGRASHRGGRLRIRGLRRQGHGHSLPGRGSVRGLREVRAGYRLELPHPERLELSLDGTRRVTSLDDMAPEHRVMLRLVLQ